MWLWLRRRRRRRRRWRRRRRRRWRRRRRRRRRRKLRLGLRLRVRSAPTPTPTPLPSGHLGYVRVAAYRAGQPLARERVTDEKGRVHHARRAAVAAEVAADHEAAVEAAPRSNTRWRQPSTSWRSRGLQRAPEGCRGLQRAPEGSRGLLRYAEGCRGLQRAAEGCRGLQRAPEGSRGLQRLLSPPALSDSCLVLPPSSERPQAISRLVCTGRPHRPCFRHRAARVGADQVPGLGSGVLGWRLGLG